MTMRSAHGRRVGQFARVALVSCLTFSIFGARAAEVSDAALCQRAIDAVDLSWHLPTDLLHAIGVVESGRVDPATRSVLPWAWSIDVEGTGHNYTSAADAIAAVRTAQSAGIRSIDVGCMQINLEQHPSAFTRLEDAFDPASNVLYAARLLNSLHTTRGDWPTAIAAYHSSTPALGLTYLRQVAAVWSRATAFGVVASAMPAIWGASSHVAVADDFDPDHTLTPVFRARMIASAAFKQRRDQADLLIQPGAMLVPPPSLVQPQIPRSVRSHRHQPDRPWLEAALDQSRPGQRYGTITVRR